MHTSEAGLSLIKRFEGCKLHAYKLPGEKNYTIGYGHSDPNVKEGDTLSQAQADYILSLDLIKFENYVKKYVQEPLSQPQFDALVSYTYNRGPKGLKQLVEASRGLTDYADNMLIYWGSAQQYKTALLKRRKAERDLFLSGRDLESVAREVIGGKWGSGEVRKKRLEASGYNYKQVQKIVNKLLK